MEKDFAEFLTELKIRAGIPDTELARRVGVDRTTIHRWSEGISKPRRTEDVSGLSLILQASPAERNTLLRLAGHPYEITEHDAQDEQVSHEFPTPVPSRGQKLELIGNQITDRTGKDMILIPAGELITGEGKDRRSVWVGAFYIDKYPVTNREYSLYVHSIKAHAFKDFDDPSPEPRVSWIVLAEMVIASSGNFMDEGIIPQTSPPGWATDEWQTWCSIYQRLKMTDSMARAWNEAEAKSKLYEQITDGVLGLLSSLKKDSKDLEKSPDYPQPKSDKSIPRWREDALEKWVRKHLCLPYGWNVQTLTYPLGKGDDPVTQITRKIAESYCRWRSEINGMEVRLPAEEEWDLAARRSDTHQQAGDNRLLSGDVWEFTSSETPGWRRFGGQAVLKRGSLKNADGVASTTDRRFYMTDKCDSDVGFRCIIPVETNGRSSVSYGEVSREQPKIVELQHGEEVLMDIPHIVAIEEGITLRRIGNLFLTNRRVIWEGGLFGVSKKTITVELSQIIRVEEPIFDIKSVRVTLRTHEAHYHFEQSGREGHAIRRILDRKPSLVVFTERVRRLIHHYN